MKKNDNYIAKRYGEILHIFDPVFKINYYYFGCKKEEDFLKILKIKFKIDKAQHDSDGGFNVFEQHGQEVCFIWARNNDLEVIVHEICHAVHYVLETRGIQLSEKTDEIYCYLSQFLFSNIYKNIKKECE